MYCQEPRTREEIMHLLGLKHLPHFRSSILQPLLAEGLLEQTIPDKPKSPNQKYVARKKMKPAPP